MDHERASNSSNDAPNVFSYNNNNTIVNIANFHNKRSLQIPHFPKEFNSQRSLYSERCRSPRSMCSTATVSASDIVTAFQYAQFNKQDWAIIKHAYEKYNKKQIRKRHERHRRQRLRLKVGQQNGGDSGEQGSESSFSDDDRMSISTSNYRKSISSYKLQRSNLNDLRMPLQEGILYKDFSVKSKIIPPQMKDTNEICNLSNNFQIKSNHASILQKDRFKTRYPIGSQRFKRTFDSTIKENVDNPCLNVKNNFNKKQKKADDNIIFADGQKFTSDSENEDRFLGFPINNKNNRKESYKRQFEYDENTQEMLQKRQKLSPIKNISGIESRVPKTNNGNLEKNKRSPFVFAKPSFPVKKITNTKSKEILISKSAEPPNNLISSTQHDTSIHSEKNNQKDITESTDISTSNMSMRPSFIKRKLFSQKLDMIEDKNESSDCINSPVNSGNKIQKEKNKTRKLVTGQSCLSRDVPQEDNFMDLIHKIVPANQMNATKKSIKAKNGRYKNDATELNATLISGCNSGNESETYTDDDIFQESILNNSKHKKQKPLKKACDNKSKDNIKGKDKITLQKCNPIAKTVGNSSTVVTADQGKNRSSNNIEDPEVKVINYNAKTYAQKFWDTDFESDFECQNIQKKLCEPQTKNLVPDILKEREGSSNVTTTKNHNEGQNPSTLCNITTLENSSVNVNKTFYNISLRVRSHRLTKRKKFGLNSEVTEPATNGHNSSTKCKSDFQRESDSKITKSEVKDTFTSDCTDMNKMPQKVSNSRILVDKKSNQTMKSIRSNNATNVRHGKATRRSPRFSSKKQMNQKQILRKPINLSQNVSDISFSIPLESSIITRSMSKSISSKNITMNSDIEKLSAINIQKKSLDTKKSSKTKK